MPSGEAANAKRLRSSSMFGLSFNRMFKTSSRRPAAAAGGGAGAPGGARNAAVNMAAGAGGAGRSDWQAVKDESTGDHYWWNTVTNETTWDKPPGAPALV